MNIQEICGVMFDRLANVRWVLVSDKKILFVLYTKQHATTYMEFDLFDESEKHIDTTMLLQRCRNIETVVYCRYASNVHMEIENGFLNILTQLGNEYRQMFPRLLDIVVTDIWYSTLRFHIIQSYILTNERLMTYILRMSADWENTYTICNTLDLPVTGWYTERKYLYDGKDAEKPSMLSVFLNDADKVETETYVASVVNCNLHDSCIQCDKVTALLEDSSKTELELWDTAAQQTRYLERFYAMYTYSVARKELTHMLIYVLQEYGLDTRTITQIKVDALGRVYLNGYLCDISIPFKYLVVMPDMVWEYVTGITKNEFYKQANEQYCKVKATYVCVENITTEYFCEVLQEQHIPRWGFLLDYCFLLDLRRLTDIDIALVEVADLMQRDMSLKYKDYYHRFPSLHTGHFRINGCVVSTDLQQSLTNEDLLQEYIQMYSTLNKRY